MFIKIPHSRMDPCPQDYKSVTSTLTPLNNSKDHLTNKQTYKRHSLKKILFSTCPHNIVLCSKICE